MIQVLMKCNKCPSAKIVNPETDLWAQFNNLCGFRNTSNVFSITNPEKWHFLTNDKVLLCPECSCAAVETRDKLTKERDEKLAEFVRNNIG